MCPSLCLAKLSSAPRSLHRRPFLWEAFLDPDQLGPSPPAGLRLGWREQAVVTGLLEVCQQYGAGVGGAVPSSGRGCRPLRWVPALSWEARPTEHLGRAYQTME